MARDQSALDSDNDGIPDTEEVALGTDPDDPDSDDDGLLDGDEITLGTDPSDPDSDDDGLLDGDEVAMGTDPNTPTSLCGDGRCSEGEDGIGCPEDCPEGAACAADQDCAVGYGCLFTRSDDATLEGRCAPCQHHNTTLYLDCNGDGWADEGTGHTSCVSGEHPLEPLGAMCAVTADPRFVRRCRDDRDCQDGHGCSFAPEAVRNGRGSCLPCTHDPSVWVYLDCDGDGGGARSGAYASCTPSEGHPDVAAGLSDCAVVDNGDDCNDTDPCCGYASLDQASACPEDPAYFFCGFNSFDETCYHAPSCGDGVCDTETELVFCDRDCGPCIDNAWDACEDGPDGYCADACPRGPCREDSDCPEGFGCVWWDDSEYSACFPCEHEPQRRFVDCDRDNNGAPETEHTSCVFPDEHHNGCPYVEDGWDCDDSDPCCDDNGGLLCSAHSWRYACVEGRGCVNVAEEACGDGECEWILDEETYCPQDCE